MNKIYSTLSLLLLTAITGFSQCLVSYYPFNGNANDSIPGGNNGIVNGATFTADRFGNPNSALHFNGNFNYVDFAYSSIVNDVPFTLVAWIKHDTTNVYAPIITLGCIGSSTLNELGFAIYMNNHLTIGTPGANDVTSNLAVAGSYQWIQVAVVHTNGYNASSFKFYINGVPYGTNNTVQGTNNPFSMNNSMNIGRSFGGGSSANYFKGDIDDVRIYDCTLTDAQVASLYNPATSILNSESDKDVQFNVSKIEDKLFISINDWNLSNKHMLTLIDVMGKTLFETETIAREFTIDVSSFKPGIYYTVLNSETSRYYKKIIITE